MSAANLPKAGNYFIATSTYIDLAGWGEHSTSIELIFRIIGTGFGYALECSGLSLDPRNAIPMDAVMQLFETGQCPGLHSHTSLTEPELLSDDAVHLLLREEGQGGLAALEATLACLGLK